ncbi:uncharacterized protein [Panulirus ornatus]|uniref:uncharacterized protein n=1 Tax=Panulirus ornatus TaxID=150431 RepID=UPI003A844581
MTTQTEAEAPLAVGQDTKAPNTTVGKEAPIRYTPAACVILERRSDLRKSLVYIVAYLMMEIGKQLSNFALSRANDGQYPVPSSLLVLLTECTKLLIILAWAMVMNISLLRWSPSLKFCLPAICYFMTNLLYLLALRSVPPPLWMILIQTRTLYTAAVYTVVFGRELTWVEVVGCLLVVASIPLARLSELQGGHLTLTSSVMLTSQVCAILSTVASVAVELLLKNDARSFCEQQAWLYLWGSLLGALAISLHPDLDSLSHLLQENRWSWSMATLLVLAVASSALAGLCVPFIVKNLDSIAKDYLAALNNMLLSAVTALLFPLHFTITWLYLLALALLILGIWLYERKVIWRHP